MQYAIDRRKFRSLHMKTMSIYNAAITNNQLKKYFDKVIKVSTSHELKALVLRLKKLYCNKTTKFTPAKHI